MNITPSRSTFKIVDDIVRDLNADGISEDPVVHADGKGSDGAPYDSIEFAQCKHEFVQGKKILIT
jgi:hypothetical protein